MICEFFWDFDGTLFDTYPRMARALVCALAELGYDAEYDWTLNGMKRSLGDAARAANARFGVDAQAVMDAYHRHAEDEGPQSMLPYPGAREVLAAIAQGGGRNYLYTHRNHTALEALKRWDMRKWFRDFVTKEDGFPSKPAPDALMGALLRGPEHEELASPFPEGVTLRRWEWDPDQPGNLVVTLSEQYGELSEIALTLADYAIVLTLSQLEGVETVEIQAEGFVGNYRSHQRLSAGEATLWDGVARPEMEATGGGG